MVGLRTSMPLLSSDAFRLLRKTVMPSDSSTSSSSESDSSASRRSRRSRRERRPAQDRDRSRSPRRGSRAPDEAEQERLERERRERSRESLERIVEEDRLRREQSEERRAQQNQPDGQQPADERQEIGSQFSRRVKNRSSSNSRWSGREFCPQVDSSFSRRFKDIKTPEMSKAEATERSLKAEQYNILDVARPLLFLREKIAESADLRDSPLAEAADTALRLWGHTFHNVTTSRRENLLKVSDPKFLSLLKEPHRFKPRECASLFGRHFIKNMVKEATDDQTLRSISSSHGSSSRPRAGSSGYRGTSSRSHRGENFGQGGYSNGYNGGSSGTFNRSRGNHSIRSENLSLPNYSLDSPPIVGGRLRHFVDSWKCLSSDPWVLNSISQGVKLEFLASPFQARNQSNMEMGESQWALCNQEIQDIVRKEAIEPVEESEQKEEDLAVTSIKGEELAYSFGSAALRRFPEP
ncbi:hypothetical protein DAPPUDRAFT_106830 [Daphnia pulex]|uniref:Uncharacterized protein n=1 Tax=Daphnia pulex TaxID=6669 RepID=E9GV35_DAPPU|nr:hypothetical protein DAPPUDRAFT_106830 [Daphnia pulex]|eukprot:EFX76596.1 hypothetical protein DAPPUDRAFT_106830 [Daphnia pulex]